MQCDIPIHVLVVGHPCLLRHPLVLAATEASKQTRGHPKLSEISLLPLLLPLPPPIGDACQDQGGVHLFRQGRRRVHHDGGGAAGAGLSGCPSCRGSTQRLRRGTAAQYSSAEWHGTTQHSTATLGWPSSGCHPASLSARLKGCSPPWAELGSLAVAWTHPVPPSPLLLLQVLG